MAPERDRRDARPVRSARLTGVRAAVPARHAAAGSGTRSRALGSCLAADHDSDRPSALKLIASPCGDGGSGIRCGVPGERGRRRRSRSAARRRRRCRSAGPAAGRRGETAPPVTSTWPTRADRSARRAGRVQPRRWRRGHRARFRPRQRGRRPVDAVTPVQFLGDDVRRAVGGEQQRLGVVRPVRVGQPVHAAASRRAAARSARPWPGSRRLSPVSASQTRAVGGDGEVLRVVRVDGGRVHRRRPGSRWSSSVDRELVAAVVHGQQPVAEAARPDSSASRGSVTVHRVPATGCRRVRAPRRRGPMATGAVTRAGSSRARGERACHRRGQRGAEARRAPSHRVPASRSRHVGRAVGHVPSVTERLRPVRAPRPAATTPTAAPATTSVTQW